MHINELLAYQREKEASDLHLVVGQKPVFRVAGEMVRRDEDPVLDAEAIESLLLPHLDDARRARLDVERRDVDITLRQGDRRFRAHVFRDRGGLGAAVRIVPNRVPTLEELGILEHAPVLEKLTRLKRGLIVMTGPMGSGKTTLCAAMLEEINRTRAERIVTFEDPIEYEFTSKESLVSQRSVGEDIRDYPEGLRSVMYMDPDVILIDRLRDLETIMMAITAAETGHLVFVNMNIPLASGAIWRIVDSFPEGQRAVIREILSRNLQAVVAQMLVPKAGPTGRVAAHEILIATPRVREMIASGTGDFTLAIEASREIGMRTMDDSLFALAEKGAITREMARSRMADKSRLSAPPEQNENGDPSFAFSFPSGGGAG